MKLLFVGENWQGSSARSMREALAALPGIEVQDISEDLYKPAWRSKLLRVAARLIGPALRQELGTLIRRTVEVNRPDALVVYKGWAVGLHTVRSVASTGILTVNIFPDLSPTFHGSRLRDAMGAYDLVISTKPFHPDMWIGTFGYKNLCVCVPHGYDPAVHLLPLPNDNATFDVLLVATWRPQYEELMRQVARQLLCDGIVVNIVGNGWESAKASLPTNCLVGPAVSGRAYAALLHRARIVIAPLHPSNNELQIGDVDTTRTYELAAANCFFLHRRTSFVQTIYDERTEVPMWDDADELVRLIRRFLPNEATRRDMATAAHARAVPAYSIPSRAREVAAHIQAVMMKRNHAK